MATIILVHGLSMARVVGSCLSPLLQAGGHKIVAPNLPGMGADKTALAEVTLESSARFIADIVVRRDAPGVALEGPEPVASFVTPVTRYTNWYGLILRTYVEWLRNEAVSLDLRCLMRNELPCEFVEAIDSGHSPFFSATSELANCLPALAGQFLEENRRPCEMPRLHCYHCPLGTLCVEHNSFS